MLYGIDLLHLSQTNSEDELSPGGVNVKLSELAVDPAALTRASKKASMISESDSETLKVKLNTLGF